MNTREQWSDQELISALRGIDQDLQPRPEFADRLLQVVLREKAARRRPTFLFMAAAALLVASIAGAAVFGSGPFRDPNVRTVIIAPTASAPTSTPTASAMPTAGVSWTGAVRADADTMPLLTMDGPAVCSAENPISWEDELESPTGFVDIIETRWSPGPGTSLPVLMLSSKPPPALELDPSLALIEYGLVFDENLDGTPDYELGINNSPDGASYRVWVTDLARGGTVEQIGPPYGAPVEFRHPDEQDAGESPSMSFVLLTGVPTPLALGREYRYYAWSSYSENGSVVAWDYAPNFGWLQLPTCQALPRASEETVPPGWTLHDLPLPGMGSSKAGEYGWTGALGSRSWMHSVTTDPAYGDGYRQTQLTFAIQDDCFPRAAGAEPTSVRVAGLDGLYLVPYHDPSVLLFSKGGKTTGAYALPIGDRTLCAYLTWDAATTPEELSAAHAVVGSIRGQPFGGNGIRINFTLPAGWDTG